MAKLRLTGEKRRLLHKSAAEFVKTLLQAEQDKLEALRLEVEKFLDSYLSKEFPKADMKILARYNKADMKNQVLVRRDPQVCNNEYHQFKLSEEKLLPGNITVLLPAKLWDAYYGCEDKLEELTEKRKEPYNHLINASNTLEDVAAVWPQAEELRGKLGGAACTALSCLSQGDIQQIGKDLLAAGRALRKAA